MASAGKTIVGTLLPHQEHQELTRRCAAAGITVSDHLKRCLDLGQRLLEKDVRERQRQEE